MIDLRQGDCLEIMRDIPGGSIDMIMTDPPYGHNNNNNGDLIHRRAVRLLTTGRKPVMYSGRSYPTPNAFWP